MTKKFIRVFPLKSYRKTQMNFLGHLTEWIILPIFVPFSFNLKVSGIDFFKKSDNRERKNDLFYCLFQLLCILSEVVYTFKVYLFVSPPFKKIEVWLIYDILISSVSSPTLQLYICSIPRVCLLWECTWYFWVSI